MNNRCVNQLTMTMCCESYTTTINYLDLNQLVSIEIVNIQNGFCFRLYPPMCLFVHVDEQFLLRNYAIMNA